MSSFPTRAGIEAGPFPQRKDEAITTIRLDYAVDRLVGALRRMFGGGLGDYSDLANRVDDAEQSLKTMSYQELTIGISQFRQNLRLSELDEAFVVQGFALIREMSERTLGMRHYDVQLFGGYAMLHGNVVEMETGEGKTLTATLPAILVALSGIRVHVVTVNDYLAERDADLMRPLYEAFGLSVGTIVGEMPVAEKRAAYRCDVTYCTNKLLVFDYLRDRLVLGDHTSVLRLSTERLYSDNPRTGKLVLKGLEFAIVDEADSVLVDEARTPLIISQAGQDDDQHRIYHQSVDLARGLQQDVDFTTNERERLLTLTSSGKARLEEIAQVLGGIWTGKRRREELVHQALSAMHLFQRDRHYLVQGDEVHIIDEFTGRTMPDRSWERGLHQMIQVKEGCAITGLNETRARISYQRFFRRYVRLAGMTGTVSEVADEMWTVYRLKVVRVATNRPLKRRKMPTRIWRTADEKWRAVVDQAVSLSHAGRPTLIGTRSVADSEHLGKLFSEDGVSHVVLNARQDLDEAEIIAQVGQSGRITVATNMAGRGTDVRLGEGVAALGGLHVIATELHEARRIDRQLIGRCGRQGDPGSHQAILSLEDELVIVNLSRPAKYFLSAIAQLFGTVPPWIGLPFFMVAQQSTERRHGQARRDLMGADDRLGNLLGFRDADN